LTITFTKGTSIYEVTDNTQELREDGYFLQTAMNMKYKDKLPVDVQMISPGELTNLLDFKNKIKIIGITGTNGKTTTAACIYSILLDLGKQVALQGTRGCFINDQRIADKSLTTPMLLDTINNIQLAIEKGCEYFVMEVSSHAIAQKRIEGLTFSLKILTNLSQDHLDYHKTFENYCAVKSRFFEDESFKLINKDEKYIRFNRKNCMTYGLEKPSTYKVAAYSLQNGLSVAVQKMETVFDYTSPMHGLFNVYNTLAAIAAVDMLHVSPIEKITQAIENFAGVEGRMQVVSHEPLVIVDFAHTPDGMEKVLDSLKDKDLIVVFGAGGDRDRAKRPLMGAIASRYAKKIIVTSDNPRSEEPQEIIEEIVQGIRFKDTLHVEVNREKAIIEALQIQQKNQVVVILGKGDETYQEIKGIKKPFDDREVIKNFFANKKN
jgi:UDP-N-acetylmuramoyl-L-alanyl-D-glutamate--2,6-diaminopimelate ligase